MEHRREKAAIHRENSNGLAGSHDLRLSAWGPYTKRYMGISHIPRIEDGLRFDLSVFPGFYRRVVQIPNVTWESGYHPWDAAADLSFFRHRHDLIWKDQVYCDIDFCRLDEEAVLIRCALVNRTEELQTLALHFMASIDVPRAPGVSLRRGAILRGREGLRQGRVKLPEGGRWVGALEYESIHFGTSDPRASLQYDGWLRGEVLGHGFTGGHGLGQGFGRDSGDRVTYRVALEQPMKFAALMLRYRLAAYARLRLRLSGTADRECVLSGGDAFRVERIEIGRLERGAAEFSFTSDAGADLELDGFALVEGKDAAVVEFATPEWNYAPARHAGPREETLVLEYEHIEPAYGIAWGARPFILREIICDDLDTWLRTMVHNHTQKTLRDPDAHGHAHYTNIFMRPIVVEPRGEQIVFGLVCRGTRESVEKRLAAFDPASPDCARLHATAEARALMLAPTAAGATYSFSQQRMAATVLTNVVYPVRTRGKYIRHYTPGRWWDSLYTWDSGFTGLGLLELDPDRSIDNLNAYVTEPGDPTAAFIHHGSPVPVQFSQFLEIWNRTQSRALLEHFYPRLRQYERFIAGRLGSSSMRMPCSNLIRPWDYFHNSGGWDDYPAQVHVQQHSLWRTIAPAINTAQTIRAARVMRMMARALGEDAGEFDEDIEVLTDALQRYSWDEAAGYFSYVTHDERGRPTGFLRDEQGINFNMGLDGASPLGVATCSPAQEAQLVERLMSPERLWTRCGITAVDQSAPYYQADGYWNGAVWMPHQWFIWKVLLDLGEAEAAHRIAHTALEVWKREVESSYNCFEHFVVQSGRGAGWHHFGGLSSPVLSWFGAYFRPGRLTTGLNVWIESLSISQDHRALDAELSLDGQLHHRPAVIATLSPEADAEISWDGAPLAHLTRYPGVFEIRLPIGAGRGTLRVRSKSR